MQEVSSKQIIFEKENCNITDLLERTVKANPRFDIYSSKINGNWININVKKFHTQVTLIAKSLINQGFLAGDRIVVISPTRYEWSLVDFAMWYAGIISIPIFETSSRSQIEWILEDSGAKAAFVDSSEKAQSISEAANMVGIKLEKIWQFEGEGVGINYKTLLLKNNVTDKMLEKRRSNSNMSTIATLVYTSGTTGKSKGCALKHGNFVDLAQNVTPIVNEIIAVKNPKTILFLPLAHALSRAIQLICISANVTLAHGAINTIVDDFKTFKPTWILCVPRVLEKIYNSALIKAENSGKSKIFKYGVKAAIEYSQKLEKNKLTLRIKAKQFIFDKILYSKIRKSLGGNVKWIISGANALDTKLAHFFTGAGIPVLEGYGLSETTAPITVNTPSKKLIGSVGFVLPGTRVKIGEDGEILAKGIGIFSGYWNNEIATYAAFDKDGWFKTGDIGILDSNGFLKIIGRKKDILVTASGKNIYPTPMENGLKASLLIDQAVIVGENKPFVSALIILDEEQLSLWCKHRKIPPLNLKDASKDPKIISAIQKIVDDVNSRVSRAESIRKFKIIPESINIDSGHITPTLKLKRINVINDFQQIIDDIYI